MTDLRQQFGKRLKEAMREAGHEPKPGVLVNLFNLSHADGQPVAFMTASRWMKGLAIPDPMKVLTLARLFGVEPGDLLFGNGSRVAIGEARLTWMDGLRPADRQMVQAYIQLPPAKRRLVRDLVGQLSPTET